MLRTSLFILVIATGCAAEEAMEVYSSNSVAIVCAGQSSSTTVDVWVETEWNDVELSITGLPGGVSGSFANPASHDTVLTLRADAGAPIATQRATIRAVAYESRAETSIDVQVIGPCP